MLEKLRKFRCEKMDRHEFSEWQYVEHISLPSRVTKTEGLIITNMGREMDVHDRSCKICGKWDYTTVWDVLYKPTLENRILGAVKIVSYVAIAVIIGVMIGVIVWR